MFKLVRPEAVTAAMVTTNVTDSEAAWSAATTYSAGQIVKRTFADGLPHRVESAAGSNLNHDPATDDGTWWTDLGPTNAYAMFDGRVQTQTTRADSVAASADFGADVIIDTLYLENLEGTQVVVTQTDAVEGVVYSETISLVSDGGIADFWPWCFEPPSRLHSVVLTDLKPYAGMVLGVTITEAGALVSCGALVTGLSRSLGGTQYGVQLGVLDYSVKQASEIDGSMYVLERAYSKTADFAVMVVNDFVDETVRLLADYRARPVLLVGVDAYAATAVWGFIKDWSVEISWPDRSLLNIAAEGLT